MKLASARATHAFVLAALLAACGSSSDDDDSFVLRVTTQPAETSALPVVAGNWMVYFAREAFSGPTGTDLNGDGLKDDQVAFAVNLAGPSETNLMVAARGAVILANEIFLKVVESEDGVDWNGVGGPVDTVLLHWSLATGVVTFVDTLDLAFADEVPAVVGTRLFYAAFPSVAPAPDETNLRVLTSANPTTPAAVLNEAGGGNLRAHLYGPRSGLVFAFLDETENALDHNGDGDMLDDHVLALLDGTIDGGRLKGVGLALASDVEPLAARSLGTSDWLAAFLVDEAAQGLSLNDQTLLDGGNPVFTQPILPNLGCANDLDTNDAVLHYLDYSGFVAATEDVVNTGIVGQDRVLVGSGFVATLSSEVDSNCNLNDDADGGVGADLVLRWVETVLPNAPVVDTGLLHALATGTAGGSMGFALLDNRLVAVVDEAADDDDFDTESGEASADHELIAWIEPTLSSPVWHFSHQSGASQSIGTGVFDSTGSSEPFAGTTWLAAEAVGDRLPLVFLEEVPGETNANVGSLNTNLDCDLVLKDSDKTDGLPVWADFEGGPTLDFDGVGYAVHQTNAGIEIAAGFVFFRVSEADDARDYNGDNQMNDVVLFRNPLTSCNPAPLGTASLVPGPVLITDRVAGGAFFTDEAMAGVDLNADGDMGDVVLRYFRF
jgi:hypothetical protein